jgi:hypothetical protein
VNKKNNYKFRHEVRKYVADRDAQDELEAQNKKELAEIESKHRDESSPSNSDKTESVSLFTTIHNYTCIFRLLPKRTVTVKHRLLNQKTKKQQRSQLKVKSQL